ncbi:unnamed protein product, partial [Toxocara canis]|uniref:N-terminal Ras-GEF domain-containing protein n=1 Tax=Toxocara canis TaxID=6265 RepID=A0A183U0V0_TOXCA
NGVIEVTSVIRNATTEISNIYGRELFVRRRVLSNEIWLDSIHRNALNLVRGGPKDALIAFATQQAGSLLYQEAFLTTYRTFVSSLELIQKLVRRYLYMCLSEDQASTKAARQSFSVLVRVVDELCAVELTRDLVRAVTSFVYRLIRDGNYTFAKILRTHPFKKNKAVAKVFLYAFNKWFYMRCLVISSSGQQKHKWITFSVGQKKLLSFA